jgi:protein gp37
MNKTSIEFCDFTLNPIIGCRNGCKYCWARKLNNRYFKNNDFFTPKFYPERLNEKIPGLPKKRNEIAKMISLNKPIIFMVDMGDIFSDGVHLDWKKQVFRYAEMHKEVNFLFLTKRPNDYINWTERMSINVFLGTSIDYAHNKGRLEPIKTIGRRGFRTFVNIEPLMSRMDGVDFSGIDFVIVGALTGQKYRPDPGWHKSIKHPRIYYKKNYQVYFPELIYQL